MLMLMLILMLILFSFIPSTKHSILYLLHTYHSKVVYISDLDLESAFRIRYRNFDLDSVCNFSMTYPECCVEASAASYRTQYRIMHACIAIVLHVTIVSNVYLASTLHALIGHNMHTSYMLAQSPEVEQNRYSITTIDNTPWLSLAGELPRRLFQTRKCSASSPLILFID